MAENSLIHPIKLIVIGGSAGSLDVLLKLVAGLPPHLPAAILVVTHRKASSEDRLVELLNARSSWAVREAEEKDLIVPNTIYIAPTDYHLLIEQDYSFSLDVSEKVNYSRPSIDITFESAAEVYGPSMLGILLSGANADGVEGLRSIKKRGGLCLVQDPGTAEVDYMPRQAIEQVEVDQVLPPAQLSAYIHQLFLH